MGLNEKDTGITNNGLNESGDIPANSSQIKALTNDGVITERVVLTQAEYDVLDPKVETTEYIIVG